MDDTCRMRCIQCVRDLNRKTVQLGNSRGDVIEQSFVTPAEPAVVDEQDGRTPACKLLKLWLHSTCTNAPEHRPFVRQ